MNPPFGPAQAAWQPGSATRRDVAPPAGRPVPDRTDEIVWSSSGLREQFGVVAVRATGGGAASEHKPPDHAGVLRSHLQADRTAVAIADEVGRMDAECPQEHGGVIRHPLVGQRPVDISGRGGYQGRRAAVRYYQPAGPLAQHPA
jgi:hypothetical protein